MRGKERARRKRLKRWGWKILDDARSPGGRHLILLSPAGSQVTIDATTRPQAYREAECLRGITEALVHVGAAPLDAEQSKAPTLAAIRGELLQHHASLRSRAATVQDVAKRSSSARAGEQLAGLLRALAEAVDAHNRREEELLGGVTPTIDAWGDVRAARMDEHHRQEHRRLAIAVRAAAGGRDISSITQLALTAIDDLLAHLQAEESELVNTDVLRDDIIVIGQSDG